MDYLNHTLTMFVSNGDKTLAQLSVSALSIKRHLELSL